MKKFLLFLLIVVMLLSTVALVLMKLAGVAPVAAWSWWRVTIPISVPWACFCLVRLGQRIHEVVILAHR